MSDSTKNTTPRSPQERLDDYLAELTAQGITGVRVVSELIYQWLVDNNIEVVCTLPQNV